MTEDPESYDPEACPWCKGAVETPRSSTKRTTCPHCGGTFVLSYTWNVDDGQGGDEHEMLEGRDPPPIKPA